MLKTPITVYNFEVSDNHTYYVAESINCKFNDFVLVHNACNKNVFKELDRKPAIKEGKQFLGDDFVKVGKGRYASKDGKVQCEVKTIKFVYI